MDNAGRKLMEQAVLLSAEKFYRAFNANPLPCSISTLKEGRYVDVNESFMDYYGYTRDEVIGKTRLELNIYADPTQHEEIKQLFARHNVIRNFNWIYFKINSTLASIPSLPVFIVRSYPVASVISYPVNWR
jgi:PAS domain-containing protein